MSLFPTDSAEATDAWGKGNFAEQYEKMSSSASPTAETAPALMSGLRDENCNEGKTTS